MKKEILWVSLCAPYEKVPHAGGKIHNYYIKKLNESGEYDIKLITFCGLSEYEEARKDHESFRLSSEIIPWTHTINFSNIKRRIQFTNFEINPFQYYAGETNHYYWDQILKCLKKNNYNPEIIILQWTQIALFAGKFRKMFPKAKIIAIEEDVMFLSYYRKYVNSGGGIKKQISLYKYNRAKQIEVRALKQADSVIVNNPKDKKLIEEEAVRNISIWVPFFTNYHHVKRGNKPNHDLLFYGAMSRVENYSTAIWVIEKVLPLLADTDLRFVIVGSNPNKELLKYCSERVIVTGYIEDVSQYFEECLCLVAPLVHGAGIKVKILEAMSAGIPVLTNDIGIEGIPAGRDSYLHCSSPEDYATAIRKILNGEIDGSSIGQNGAAFINDQYNFGKSYTDFVNLINNLKED